MKVVGPGVALQAIVLALALVGMGHAEERAEGGAGRQGFQGKVEYCETCHGLSGEGYRGYYAMPRLAGQQPKYIENQLRAFIEHRRVNPIMFSVAHALNFHARRADRVFQGSQSPARGWRATRALGARKNHLRRGPAGVNIAACSACHGPEAKGHEEIPRLAGQLYSYTVKALTYWSKERGQGAGKEDPSAIMVPTTHN